MTAVPIPQAIADKIEVAPPEAFRRMTPRPLPSLDRRPLKRTRCEKLQSPLKRSSGANRFYAAKLHAAGVESRRRSPSQNSPATSRSLSRRRLSTIRRKSAVWHPT